MSNVQAAIKRNRVVVLLILLAALAVLLAGVRSGGPTAASADDSVPAYQDSSLPVDQRVADLLGRMTLAEKIGQMGQINVEVLQGAPDTPWDRGPLNPDLMTDVLDKNQIGSILSGGGAWPPVGDDGKAWAEEINTIQQFGLDHSRLRIPIIYGADAVHGHNNLVDATMVPHQIGLGATFDPWLAEQLGRTTASAVRATGVAWDFAPVLDTERDLRWGRSYEPFGEDPVLTGAMGAATIRGLQGRNLASPTSVAATAKHFAGYSAPDSGFDRTDATIDDNELQSIHLPSFAQGIDAGVATVMVNSGSVNGVPGHASHRMLTDILRDQLHFKGVVISDWQDVENLITKYHVATDMEDAISQAVNAGLDMSMIPLDAGAAASSTNLTKAVADGKVTEARINESVARILTLKFRLGLFEHPFVDANAANAAVENPAAHQLARKAAQESLVLLRNDGTLPLSSTTRGASSSRAPRRTARPTSSAAGRSPGRARSTCPPDIPTPEVTTIKEGVQQAAGHGTQVVWKQGAPVADTTNRTSPDGTTNPNLPQPPDPLNDPANATVAAAARGRGRRGQARRRGRGRGGREPVRRGPGRRRHARPPARAGEADRRPEGHRQAGDRGRGRRAAAEDGPPARRGEREPDGLPARVPRAAARSPTRCSARPARAAGCRSRGPRTRARSRWPTTRPGKPYDPRFPFGYGLSYTRFKLDDLRAPWHASPGQRISASVDVANVGRSAGTDTVLAFLVAGDGSRRLVAFDRVEPGRHHRGTAHLTFSAPAGSYKLVVGDLSRPIRVG